MSVWAVTGGVKGVRRRVTLRSHLLLETQSET